MVDTNKVKIYTKSGDSGKTSLFDGKRYHKYDIAFKVMGSYDELNAELGKLYVSLDNDISQIRYDSRIGFLVSLSLCMLIPFTFTFPDKDIYSYTCIFYILYTTLSIFISTYYFNYSLNNNIRLNNLSLLQKNIVSIQKLNMNLMARLGRGNKDDIGCEIKKDDVLLIEALIDRMEIKLPKLTNFIINTSGMSSALSNSCRAISRRAEREFHYFKNENYQTTIFECQYINRISDLLFVMARYIDHLNGGLDDIMIFSRKKE